MATTYDSGYPLGESGDYGQRGLGGPNKYMVCEMKGEEGVEWEEEGGHVCSD